MNEIKQLLKNHRYKKHLGQSFLFDKNLLQLIVEAANVSKDDIVVEIGTGIGTLTKELANASKKVISLEIDKDLMPLINLYLSDISNVDVAFLNILKMQPEEFFKLVGEEFKVVANIPYNITTPLIMYFIENNLPVESLTIMVQEEVANRLVAKPGEKDYGAITLAINLEGDCKIVKKVSRFAFRPVPKVDSAVLKIDLNRDKYKVKNKEILKKLIKTGFQMRRKTLLNNILQQFPHLERDFVASVIEESGFDRNVRGERLSVDDYIFIHNKLKIN